MNEPLKRRIRKPRPDAREEQQQLRTSFDMLSEEQLGLLWDVTVKTLKNRDPVDLPPFTKCGSKRLYFRDDVLAFMRKRMNV